MRVQRKRNFKKAFPECQRNQQAQAGQLPQLWAQAAQQAVVAEREGQADPAAGSQEVEAEVQVEVDEVQEVLDDAEGILDLSAGHAVDAQDSDDEDDDGVYIPIDELDFDQLESDLSSEVDVFVKIDLNDYEFDNWEEELKDDEWINREKTNKLHKMMNQVAW